MFLFRKSEQKNQSKEFEKQNKETEEIVRQLKESNHSEIIETLKQQLFDIHKIIADRIAARYCYTLHNRGLYDDVYSVANLAIMDYINNKILIEKDNNITPRLIVYVHSKIYRFLLKEFRLLNKRLLHKTGMLAGKRNLSENYMIKVFELNDIMDSCLETNNDRKVFDLVYAGWTLKEIAIKLELNYSWVRTIIARIRKRFKEKYYDE